MIITCSQCQHQQESGKFCGSCGADLSSAMESTVQQPAQTEVAAGVHTQPAYTNENLTKAKEGVSKYWSFALDVLKRPSIALTGTEGHFVNGLVTIAVYVVAFALSLYFLANKLFKTMFGGMGSLFGESPMGAQSLPFFDIVSPLFMFALLFVAGALLSSFAAIKMMSDSLSFKGIIGQFGSVIIPFAALNVIAIIFGLTGSIQVTLLLTALSLLFPVIVMPALVVYDRSMQNSRPVNRIYWSVGASALSLLIAYLVVRTSVMSFMEDMDQFMNMLDLF